MYKVAVLPGDGVGQEVVKAAMLVLERAAKLYSLSCSFDWAAVGGAAIDQYGEALPATTLEICDQADAIFLGAVGGPQWDHLPPEQQPERAALMGLRSRYKLFANVRPVRLYPQLAAISPLKEQRAQADFVVFRELTGGLYFGKPKGIAADQLSAVDTLSYKVEEIERIVRLACQTALKRDAKLCSVDKANVLATGQLWRKTVERIVAAEFPEIELEHLYVDNAAMQLVLKPAQFSVIVTENTFGDILTDEAAALVGSIGLLASASFGEGKFGLYEPIHGSGLMPPAIAGKGIANPLAQIASAALMLRYSLAAEEAARAIEEAIDEVLNQGYRSADIAAAGEKTITTEEMGEAVSAALKVKEPSC